MVVVIISLVTCLLMIASIIFFPKIKLYWVIGIIGALIIFATGQIRFLEALQGLAAPTPVNPIKILVLFLSMAALSVFLDEVGLFAYLANAILVKAKVSQKRLFFALYAIISVLTVFTANDIIILTFTPFICYFAKNAKINPIPYLVGEFAAANTWSMLFIIGNPTNVYIATSAGITFLQYFYVMILPTIFAGLMAVGIVYLLFRKQLKIKICDVVIEKVSITDKGLLVLGLIHLFGCTLLMVISSYVNLEMWLISAAFAASLLACVLVYKISKRSKSNELLNCLKRLPYELVPFVISMFIIVLALEKVGITKNIADLFVGEGIIHKYGWASFLTSNLINNIPMSVLFEAITKNLIGAAQSRAVYASIIGSNIGALLSPIGALAGIMWMSILKKQNIKFSFVDFIKYGLIISVATMLAAIIGLQIVL